MIHASHRSIAPLFLCLISLAACSGDRGAPALDTPPEPGTLTVTLTSPQTDVGAVSLVLRGDGIASPTAIDADHKLFVFDGPQGSHEVRLALVGEGLSGPLVRFAVPDVGAASSYSVELVSVADEANEIREDLSGYEVRLVSNR